MRGNDTDRIRISHATVSAFPSGQLERKTVKVKRRRAAQHGQVLRRRD